MATLIHPQITLEWAGRDVSADLSPYVKSITLNDSLSRDGQNQPDTISLTLNNKGRVFLSDWFPTKGDTLKAGIKFNSDLNGRETPNHWRWGEFEIDDVRYRFSPDEVIVGASAAPFKREQWDKAQSRGWTNIQLSTLTQLIAAESGMGVLLTVPDVLLDRVEQQSESAQSLMQRLSKRINAPINIKDKRLIVGIPPDIPELVVALDKRQIQKLDLPSAVRTGVSAVEVDYYDQLKKSSVVYRAGDPNATGTQIVRLYDAPASSIDEAKRYAEAELESRLSKGKSTGSITLIATPISSGQPLRILGIGKLHPLWIVQSQTTTVTSKGWTATARIGQK
ncbi:phage late control D family protein [Shewanella halifaxensis]|uniref:phage late control D family protein n=1 Tax=Shewanella halifaxensis TaxID=271098 RepID=UPI000D59C13C|nr:hypothetical protein [Shewanella halifaxensis]